MTPEELIEKIRDTKKQGMRLLIDAISGTFVFAFMSAFSWSRTDRIFSGIFAAVTLVFMVIGARITWTYLELNQCEKALRTMMKDA